MGKKRQHTQKEDAVVGQTEEPVVKKMKKKKKDVLVPALDENSTKVLPIEKVKNGKQSENLDKKKNKNKKISDTNKQNNVAKDIENSADINESVKSSDVPSVNNNKKIKKDVANKKKKEKKMKKSSEGGSVKPKPALNAESKLMQKLKHLQSKRAEREGGDTNEKVEKDTSKVDKKKVAKAKENTTGDKSAELEDNEDDAVKAENDLNEDPDEDPEKAAVRAKKREKRKLKKLAKIKHRQELAARAGTAKPAALDYLDLWKNKRAEWKFSKLRQTWLLHNIFNETTVNDDRFEVLLEYLEGLKGSARNETVEAAEKIISAADDEDDDEDDENDDDKTEGPSASKLERARQVIQLLSS